MTNLENAIFTHEEVLVYDNHMTIHSKEWTIGKLMHCASLLFSTAMVNC